MATELTSLPDDLPVPVDDGRADHAEEITAAGARVYGVIPPDADAPAVLDSLRTHA